MTYIVGIQKRAAKFVSIISDVMVTKHYRDGTTQRDLTALKTVYILTILVTILGTNNFRNNFRDVMLSV